MSGEGLNGDSKILWEFIKRELDNQNESLNRVEKRLLEKFDHLDKRQDERDIQTAANTKRLDNVESTVAGYSKFFWVFISALVLTGTGLVLTALLHL